MAVGLYALEIDFRFQRNALFRRRVGSIGNVHRHSANRLVAPLAKIADLARDAFPFGNKELTRRRHSAETADPIVRFIPNTPAVERFVWLAHHTYPATRHVVGTQAQTV